MNKKKLIIIFVLFLLIALAGGLAIFLVTDEDQPIGNEQSSVGRVEQIQAILLINGAKYQATVKPASSVYDLMSALKEQEKFDFKSSNYSGMGFFITEINGVKNDPAGKNWLYYVNGKLASVGISFYKLNNNDTIEWKYEKKSF